MHVSGTHGMLQWSMSVCVQVSVCVVGWGLFTVPSLFMPTAKHFWKRQKGQRFLCERFIVQLCCSAQM